MITGYGESAPKGCEPTKVRSVALVLGYKSALIWCLQPLVHIVQQIVYHRAYGLKSESFRPRQNIRTDNRYHCAGGYVQMREKGNEQSSPVQGAHSNVQESRAVFGVRAVY